MASVEPFRIAIDQADLEALKASLARSRWPEKEPVSDWSQGVPLAAMQALCAYWRDHYDWRRCEAMLNAWGMSKTRIDGLDIAFLHVRSSEAEALPVVMTHGWPGSVMEFHKVIGPLTDPVAHGGIASDAFHLVLPCLPGFGFSGRPRETGWDIQHTARAWIELMNRLGYVRYVAQGGDWGGTVSSAIATMAPPGCLGIHLNLAMGFPTEEEKQHPTEAETAALAALDKYFAEESGYAKQQSTRPQTIGYALTDSPVGQAAWIFEKFRNWTDCDGDPLSVLTQDELLDNIMLYWLTGTAASSARMYWESMATTFQNRDVALPVGVTIFPSEIFRPSRRWAERSYRNITYWNEVDRGGHFAAFEQPEIFVEELRNCFRKMR